MTFTRTYTLEEYALSALCDGRPVRLHCRDINGTDLTGVVGKIIAIKRSRTESDKRVIEVWESPDLPNHEVALDYGVVEYL